MWGGGTGARGLVRGGGTGARDLVRGGGTGARGRVRVVRVRVREGVRGRVRVRGRVGVAPPAHRLRRRR